jgi:hypothetical protein
MTLLQFIVIQMTYLLPLVGALLIADHGAAAVGAARPFSAGKRNEPKPLDRPQ